jgi:putative DNA primase/helicase
MTEVASWRDEADSPIARQQVQKVAQQAAQEQAKSNAQAAQKALWILSQCVTKEHSYMASKGFPDEAANVWEREDGPLLVIPMRIGAKVVGCQLIGEDGAKKFLTGQRTGNAEFVFANGGDHILCEGYATALSVRHALRNLKKKYTLHVCFSAGNMTKVAANLSGGFLIADNDDSGTGERVAREIGWPYWMSDRIGEDANDYQLRVGLFSLAQGINKAQRLAAVT